MKYVILALLVTSSLSVFAEETKTEVCTKVNQSNHCKAPNKVDGGKCVDPNGKEVAPEKGSDGATKQ